MLYYYLAQSFNELDRLVYLVQKVEDIEKPFRELNDETFLQDEIHRIKFLAAKHILLFNQHWYEYLRLHLTMVYDLWIRVLEILISLPELLLMCDRQRYQYKYCLALREELENLEAFFLQLSHISAG